MKRRQGKKDTEGGKRRGTKGGQRVSQTDALTEGDTGSGKERK